MLSALQTLRTLPKLINTQPVLANAATQFVRWKRKPVSLGTAKSKLYKVPARATVDPAEAAELKRLYNNYRTQMKSIRRYLTYRYSVRFTASVDSEQHRKEFEEDFARCSRLNDEWNNKQRIAREERLKAEHEQELKNAEQIKKAALEKAQEEYDRREEIVRKEIQASKHFVTEESLDQAIEYAINNPVHYDFAIDLKGNKYIGSKCVKADEAEDSKTSAIKQ